MRLLLVKNPWGSFRWNGRYSTNDTKNWTEHLKKKFHFHDLAKYDNGIFWMDLDSVCEYFEFMDVNWNPALLIYRQSVFDLWKAAEMVNDDVNLSKNPQYVLNFIQDAKSTSKDIISWIIISNELTQPNWRGRSNLQPHSAY